MRELRVIINDTPREHLGFALEAVEYVINEMPFEESIISRRGAGSFFIRRSNTTVSVFWQADAGEGK